MSIPFIQALPVTDSKTADQILLEILAIKVTDEVFEDVPF